ncbi:MAG: glycoside hydrolase family 92 protein, partial [Maribacter sp.]|nr:glycoside hydrolase family 92 protein [Maribacter sp.]
VNYGNQPSMQTAFIFNQLGRPDLTQYWSRKVSLEVHSKLTEEYGYNGDEDQGLMGSLAVLMKIGLFQMNGGTESNPAYEIGSPVFDKVKIHLHPDYYEGESFTIRTIDNNSDNVYIKSSTFNQKSFTGFKIHHEEIVNGGKLVLEMGSRADATPISLEHNQ